MQGIRFYLDYGNGHTKRVGQAGNALAVILPERICPDGTVECIAALVADDNSPVCGDSVSRTYLRQCCKRTSEQTARAVHPRLAWYLDNISIDHN